MGPVYTAVLNMLLEGIRRIMVKEGYLEVYCLSSLWIQRLSKTETWIKTLVNFSFEIKKILIIDKKCCLFGSHWILVFFVDFNRFFISSVRYKSKQNLYSYILCCFKLIWIPGITSYIWLSLLLRLL